MVAKKKKKKNLHFITTAPKDGFHCVLSWQAVSHGELSQSNVLGA
jgi:hypothetical protein